MNRWLDRAHGEAVPCFLLPRVTHFPFDRFPRWKSPHLVRIEHAKFMAIIEELRRIRSTDIVVTLRRVRENKTKKRENASTRRRNELADRKVIIPVR